MNSLRRTLLTILVVTQMAAACARAQTPTTPSLPPKTEANLLPPPPIAKSPVEFFRELLAMNTAERKQALTNRSPEARRQILAKVREYEALRPDLQQLRLKATELRWYLAPLLATAPTNRAAQLAAIPANDRKLVEDRLRYWDSLPSQNQAALLTNVMTLRRLTELEEGTSSALSPERLKLLNDGIAQWQALSEEDRQVIKARFDRVFTLTTDEKAKVLRTLSGPERDQIQKTLRRFGQLPAAQRAQCLENFEKFANLSLQERQQFLKNADRWNQMTPDDRQAWRDLVQRLQPQPPPPPGSLPPSPPDRPTPRKVVVGTNQ
jgi:hypothetical protein